MYSNITNIDTSYKKYLLTASLTSNISETRKRYLLNVAIQNIGMRNETKHRKDWLKLLTVINSSIILVQVKKLLACLYTCCIQFCLKSQCGYNTSTVLWDSDDFVYHEALY